MTNVRPGIRGAGRAALIKALENKSDFKTSGALSGKWTSDASSGKLNHVERERLTEDRDKHGELFIVYSYETPIAWATRKGEVYRVSQRFSVTTSKHMGFTGYLARN